MAYRSSQVNGRSALKGPGRDGPAPHAPFRARRPETRLNPDGPRSRDLCFCPIDDRPAHDRDMEGSIDDLEGRANDGDRREPRVQSAAGHHRGVGGATGLFLTSRLGDRAGPRWRCRGSRGRWVRPESRPGVDTEVPHPVARATSHAAGPQAGGCRAARTWIITRSRSDSTTSRCCRSDFRRRPCGAMARVSRGRWPARVQRAVAHDRGQVGLTGLGAWYRRVQYNNDQAATTLWYHDHTLGINRLKRLRGPGRLLHPPWRPRR